MGQRAVFLVYFGCRTLRSLIVLGTEAYLMTLSRQSCYQVDNEDNLLCYISIELIHLIPFKSE